MKARLSDILVAGTRLSVGGVLIYAGFMKAVGPSAEFAALLATYHLFPAWALTPLAIGLPYVEMWVGLFLLTGLYTRQAALAAVLLFMGFLGALASAQIRGIDLASCGCFGADIFPPRYTLMMDAILLVLASLTSRLTRFPPSLSLDRVLPKI